MGRGVKGGEVGDLDLRLLETLALLARGQLPTCPPDGDSGEKPQGTEQLGDLWGHKIAT